MNLHDVIRYLVRVNPPADKGQFRQLLLAVDRHEQAFEQLLERLHLENVDADLRELFAGAEVAPAALPGSPAYGHMLEEQRAAGIETEGGDTVTEEVEGAPAPNPNTPATEGEPGAPAPATEGEPIAPDEPIAPGEPAPPAEVPNTPAEQTPPAPAPAAPAGSEFATPTHEPGSLPVDRTASGEERARTAGDPLHAPEEERTDTGDEPG